MEILRVNAQSKYSVGRYDTFAVDKKLMLIFSVGDLILGLSAVFLAEIIQVSEIDYNLSSKNIIGSVTIRDEKVPVFDILNYFGIDSKGANAIKADEGVAGVAGGGETVEIEKGGGVKGVGSIDLDGSVNSETISYASTVSMIILKRGLGDSSELQRIGIVVDHIEGVLDEKALDRFPFPKIALNKSANVYQGLMMYSGNLVLLLNIPWLMETILPSG